jgi:hypothetical protein
MDWRVKGKLLQPGEAHGRDAPARKAPHEGGTEAQEGHEVTALRGKPVQPSVAAEESLAKDLKVFRVSLDAAMAACPGPSDSTPTLERLLTAGYKIVKAKLPKPN